MKKSPNLKKFKSKKTKFKTINKRKKTEKEDENKLNKTVEPKVYNDNLNLNNYLNNKTNTNSTNKSKKYKKKINLSNNDENSSIDNDKIETKNKKTIYTKLTKDIPNNLKI